MVSVPFPLVGESVDDFRAQVYELIRNIYEETIGGANLGDVFAIVGDVLTLVLEESIPGLTKSGNKLAVLLGSDGGLIATSNGLYVKVTSDGGLDTSASGLYIMLDGTSLETSASGLKVGQSGHINDPVGGAFIDAEARGAINGILALLEARGLMASS